MSALSKNTLEVIMKKIVAVIILVVSMVMTFTSCFAPAEKDFTAAGMTITLTEEFYEKEYISYTAVYESSDIAIFALKEEKTIFEQYGYKNLSLADYGEMVLEANSLSGVSIKKDGELSYFTYEKALNGKEYLYTAYIFDTNDAFWLIQFACLTDKGDTYSETIADYAKTVKFE